MAFMLLEERQLEGISEIKIAREGNVIQIGQFPMGFSGSVCLTGRGAWRLYMHQGNLVKKRWRQGDSVPRGMPEEEQAAVVMVMPRGDDHEAQ